MCDECKNKDVCKWLDTVNNINNFKETQDSASPVKITITCERRRK